MGMISKLAKHIGILMNLPKSLYYNFKYLPYRDAVKLPIIIERGEIKGKGKLVIEGPVKVGMIKLGFNTVPFVPNSGCKIYNSGHIRFRGACAIGNGSVLTVGNRGVLDFGSSFSASAGLMIACHHSISFLENVLVGWNCNFIDTDLHLLKYVNGGGKTKGFAPIRIGKNVWLANSCKVYKGIMIPSNCVVAADTILHSKVECPEFSLISNDHSVRVIREGVYHDRDDNRIIYSSNE